MIGRLGNVLYWLSCVAGAAVLAGGVAMTFMMLLGSNPYDQSVAPWMAFAGAVGAFVCWLIDRALRYILAGR